MKYIVLKFVLSGEGSIRSHLAREDLWLFAFSRPATAEFLNQYNELSGFRYPTWCNLNIYMSIIVHKLYVSLS